MKNVGIELGIRAKTKPIMEGAQIANSEKIDYFFIPETHPDVFGVDAFKVLDEIAEKVELETTLGTGIVSVFSRSSRTLSSLSETLYEKSNEKFVLGLGTSIKWFAKKYDEEFKPLQRMLSSHEVIKSKFLGKVYWAAVGKEMNHLAGCLADGVMYFLKPEEGIKENIRELKKCMKETCKNYEDFNTISIRPTYFGNTENTKWFARETIANYVRGNKFYRPGLIAAGFEKEVNDILRYSKLGMKEAASRVSDKMVDSLATYGSPKECAHELHDYGKRTGLKTVVAGFDFHPDNYNKEFFQDLKKFSGEYSLA